jgi:hypothetical protein
VIYPAVVLVLLPWVFLTVNETVYFPFLVYECTGFLTVEYVPSPKLHLHEMEFPVLLSVNCTLNGAFPETPSAENAATGVFSGTPIFI